MPKNKPHIPKSSSSMMSPGSPSSLDVYATKSGASTRKPTPSKYNADGSLKPFEGKEIHHNRVDVSGAYASVTDFQEAFESEVLGKFFWSSPLIGSPEDEPIPNNQETEEPPHDPSYDNFTEVLRGDGFHFLTAASAALDPFNPFGQQEQQESELATIATRTLTAQTRSGVQRRGTTESLYGRGSHDTVGSVLRAANRGHARTGKRRTV